MTDKEIIQVLRICTTHIEKGCGLCPQMKYVRCTERLADEAITMIERLTAKNAALREKQRWIPVTERMPNTIPCNAGTEYSEAVILWTTGNKAMIGVWDGIDFVCPTDFWEAWGEEITHWMPLPEAPEVE